MKARCLTALTLALICTFAAPAGAGIRPYIRFDYGSSQLKMTEVNALAMQDQTDLRNAGLQADFKRIGSGYGPSASAGLWLFPAFRVGATYSDTRSERDNRVHAPGVLFYDDQMGLRMTEMGGEAAVRIDRLGGLTLGGSAARGKAEAVGGHTVQVYGSYDSFVDAVANGTKTTYGAFVGFDQTNPQGIVGYVRVGYAYRDMGTMPSRGFSSDGYTTTAWTSNTVPLDYSGFYFKCGTGFDFFH